MKKKFFLLPCLLCLLTASSACRETTAVSKQARLQLTSPFRHFDTAQLAESRLSCTQTESPLALAADLTQGFTIRFTADLKPDARAHTLLEIPAVLNVNIRPHDPTDRKIQNYPAYPLPDGSVPVLEASLSLQSPFNPEEFQTMTVGIPLGILDKPEGKHTITLQFTGAQWSLYVDGRLYDNDFPLGYPSAARMKSWQLNPRHVTEAALYAPALQPESMVPPAPQKDPAIQYWTPPYHNAWVGDVATFFYRGRYHLFYLFDRRGHASKFGKGGHYFEHLSTADFQTWVEHEAATPIEDQWETFGTGTPFVADGKLSISYGLHTTRIYPEEMTTLAMQWDYLKKNGVTGSFCYDTIRGYIPAGSTYSVGDEGGTNFKKTHILYHPCENPSIYTDPEGRLKMLANYGARGTWGADSVAGGWKCLNADFPLGGDCTFFFRWGGYDYIIGGFTRLWSKPAGEADTAYKDLVAEGTDFYNGLSVPAVTEIPGGRLLMAGWLKMQNWGGPLVIHELVRRCDGRIGTKWMDELTPATQTPRTLASELSASATFPAPDASFLLTFEVCPERAGNGKAAVLFLPEEGDETACEWQLQLDRARAQYGTGSLSGYAADEKTLREGGAPHAAGNYAIENGMDTSRPFTVRMVVDHTGKFGGSLIDTEIDAARTLLTYRPNLCVDKVLFRMEGVAIRNIRIAPLAR